MGASIFGDPIIATAILNRPLHGPSTSIISIRSRMTTPFLGRYVLVELITMASRCGLAYLATKCCDVLNRLMIEDLVVSTGDITDVSYHDDVGEHSEKVTSGAANR